MMCVWWVLMSVHKLPSITIVKVILSSLPKWVCISKLLIFQLFHLILQLLYESIVKKKTKAKNHERVYSFWEDSKRDIQIFGSEMKKFFCHMIFKESIKYNVPQFSPLWIYSSSSPKSYIPTPLLKKHLLVMDTNS